MDSTGVFVVDKDGSMDLAKEATASYDYRQEEAYKDLCKKAFQTGRAMVGHNRAATKGAITDANAHPFVVDDRITLCHNGTLWGDWSKLTDAKVDVDSNAIAHKIHECDDDVEKALQQVNGAYALIWHDFKNNTLNFVRNNQRPLHYVETTNGWIWASEANMIEWILARHSFKAQSKVEMLNAGTLVTYDFTNNSWKLDHKDIELEAPKPAVVTQHTTYPNHPYANGYSYSGGRYMDAQWEAEDDDGVVFGGKPVCEIPQHMSGMQRKLADSMEQNTRIERAKMTGRTISNENRLAAQYKFDIPSITFAENSEKVASDNDWVLATCIDSDTVKPSDGTYGYFIYAKLHKDPNYMVKCFLPPSTSEMDILDWCLNGQEIEFHVISRQWRAYNDAAHGQGFAMLNCDLYRSPLSALDKKLEALL